MSGFMKTVLKTADTKIAGMFLGNQSDIYIYVVNIGIGEHSRKCNTSSLVKSTDLQDDNMATVSKLKNPMSEHKAGLLKVLKRQYVRANQEWLSIKFLKIRAV